MKHFEKEFVITRFVNICWSFFKLAAVVAVFAAIGLGVFLFSRLDDEIRQQVEQYLAKEFPQYNVSVGGAQLIEGEGIAIYDLAISETTSTQLQSNLLVIDEIMFSCNAKLTELMKGIPEIHRVVVRHPQVWAARSHDGEWNLSSLLPLPKCDKKKPQFIIENAQLTIADQSDTSLPSLSLRDINLTINPIVSKQAFRPMQGALATAERSLADQPLRIYGTFGGPHVERAEINALVDPAKLSIKLSSKFEQLRISKNLMAWAKAFAGKQLAQTSLLGKIDGEVTVEHQLGVNRAPHIEAKLHLKEARLDDPRLPRPLVDLSCVVNCQNEMMTVKQLRGNCGSASIALQLQRGGWAANAPLALGLRIENVTLDKKLYQALPQVLQKEWDKYEPTGVVNADIQATFDGQKWRPSAKLSGTELTFTSDKFPYRVNDGFGTMSYTPSEKQGPATLDIDLTGFGGGKPLRFVGQVFDPRPGAIGWIEVTGSNIEIEERMISALPGKSRQVIESMHPQGKFNVRWRLDRTQPGQVKPHTALRLELVNCRVNYDKFPYPLSGINGLVLAEDQRWTFRDLVTTGSRSVQCQGYLRPLVSGENTTEDERNELFLQFTGQQIHLGDDLRNALQPAVQQAWLELQPSGNVDMQAEVAYVTGSKKPTISVAVRPRVDSTTIKPKFFRYLMEQLEGTISYRDGKVLMSQLRAKHGRTKLSTNGSGEFRNDGSWEVKLEGLAVDRLMARRDLTDALPSKLQKLIEYLRPSGSFSLSNGYLRFSKASAANAMIDSEWDLQLNCLQADLQAGIELNNVHGAVRLKGESRRDRSFTAGELAIDTATFQDVQFTEIQGPIWVDERQCLFGEWATKQQGTPLRKLKAKIYDGTVVSDAWVSFDVVPRYSAVAWLKGANLKRMMRERGGSQLDYEGKVEASLNINGKGRSLATLVGHGDVQVTEANIYQLPILVSMLKVLRNASPDTTAFNQVESKFRIQGPHIYLDQLDFKGDAVSLLGDGETNFDHQLKLNFHTVVGRNESPIPLVNGLLNGLGKQTAQMTVTGSLTDPQVRTQALPGINNLIHQIQTDLDITSPGAAAPRKAERSFPSLPRWGRR